MKNAVNSHATPEIGLQKCFAYVKIRCVIKRVPLSEEKHLPNIKSAKRRVRTEEKANLRNRIVKSELKTIARKFTTAVSAGDKAAVADLSREYTGALDKAAIKGVLHRNNADRKKPRLRRRFLRSPLKRATV